VTRQRRKAEAAGVTVASTMGMGPRHSFRRVDGIRLHWVEQGQSHQRPPLVLLHGLNDCYRTWNSVAARLAHDRRILMLDLPGHGLSERPDATYRLEWYAKVVGSWLSDLSLDRFDVVGHSFGGGVAQMMLLEKPRCIRRLVLVSSGGLGREIAMALRLAALPRIVEHFGQPFMKPVTMLALRMTGVNLSERDVARLAILNGQRGSARAFARTVRDVIDWRGQRRTFFERAHELSHLPAIAVFWGDRDNVIPVRHARELSKFVDGVRLVEFKGTGHSPQRQSPDAFEAEVRSFLDVPLVPRARLRHWHLGAELGQRLETA
jgi:pimeloyl-ACP methyl ester carboxylesterase